MSRGMHVQRQRWRRVTEAERLRDHRGPNHYKAQRIVVAVAPARFRQVFLSVYLPPVGRIARSLLYQDPGKR